MKNVRVIAARNYTRGPRRGPVKVVVIHTMESPEKPDTAENVALWFAGKAAPRASAHYCVDNNSIIQCVREDDIAWHAPGANHNGIGIEHAGRAAQDGKGWSDAYSKAMLDLSVRLCADICRRHKIPAVWLSKEDLLAGRAGITSHANVSKAFKKSTHWDPGKGFPVKSYVSRVKAILDGK